MNNNCLTCGEDYFSSPLLNARTQRFGRNFLYTVLAFGALCLISYLISA